MPRTLTLRQKEYFRRPCENCWEYFRPTGVACRKCPKCLAKSKEQSQKNRRLK